jgi:hypothetical protein
MGRVVIGMDPHKRSAIVHERGVLCSHFYDADGSLMPVWSDT